MDNSEGRWKSFSLVNGSAYGGLIGNPTTFVSYIRELLKEDSRLISNDYRKLLFTENHLNNEKTTGCSYLGLKKN
ncbi:hypothetical protein [Reichenbachiella sp. MALMAid0571]|uniref:hypothetical protein n=1 Tax=Reichenbachiella sp. MALMAid0571 TaxID=3143939 RepID=UPI0032DFE82D